MRALSAVSAERFSDGRAVTCSVANATTATSGGGGGSAGGGELQATDPIATVTRTGKRCWVYGPGAELHVQPSRNSNSRTLSVRTFCRRESQTAGQAGFPKSRGHPLVTLKLAARRTQCCVSARMSVDCSACLDLQRYERGMRDRGAANRSAITRPQPWRRPCVGRLLPSQ